MFPPSHPTKHPGPTMPAKYRRNPVQLGQDAVPHHIGEPPGNAYHRVQTHNSDDGWRGAHQPEPPSQPQAQSTPTATNADRSAIRLR
jgi:hypothetical protein